MVYIKCIHIIRIYAYRFHSVSQKSSLDIDKRTSDLESPHTVLRAYMGWENREDNHADK